MVLTDWAAIDVADDSAVGEARRAVARLAKGVAFDERTAGRAAIVTTELASNLVKHGHSAQRLFARGVERHGQLGLEVVAVDGGPGTGDVANAMRDGYSTSGSPGTGLGAVRRLSDEFDIHTAPGRGTVVVCRVFPTAPDPAAAFRLEAGVFATPHPGEMVCGDAWIVLEGGARTTILVADGLGHGPEAAKASAIAVRTARRLGPDVPPAEQLTAMDESLRGTRGAAVGIASVDLDARSVAFAGVGNISAVLTSTAGTRTLVTLDGIVGHASPRVRQFDYPLPDDGLLVLHSDGIASRWDVNAHPGLPFRDPSLIAAVIHRDASRGRDDAVVVVTSVRRPPAG